MSSPAAPFVVDANAKGNNTRIDFQFAAAGRTLKGSVVVQGTFSEEDISSLRENLADGAEFDPQKLGLPDLIVQMPASWDGDEYLHRITRIMATDAEFDDEAPSTDQIIALVEVSSAPQVWSTEALTATR